MADMVREAVFVFQASVFFLAGEERDDQDKEKGYFSHWEPLRLIFSGIFYLIFRIFPREELSGIPYTSGEADGLAYSPCAGDDSHSLVTPILTADAKKTQRFLRLFAANGCK